MTSNDDLSPEDVQKAQALAPQLDPDTARAIQEGNVPVMQAIRRGARTDAEITQTLISMGLTTGLPPGLQQMVAEQMRQIDEKKHDADAAHNDRRERTLADTLAAFATVGTPDKDAAASSEAQARQMWQGVSSAELARLTYADWSALSQPQKKALVAETKDRADAAVDYTAKDFEAERNRIQKQMQAEGATEDQAIERMRNIMTAIYDADGAAFNLATPEGQAAAKANLANLPPEDQARAQQLLDAAIKFAHADKARDHAHDAKKPGATDQQQHKGVVSANDHIAKIGQNTDAYGYTNPAHHQQIVRSTDYAALQGDKLASTAAEKARLDQAVITERQAGATQRTTIAAASLQAASGDGGFGADEPPERKSIDCAHLTCSQLAPPLPEAQKLAATDPTPEPPADPHQPQKPAVPRPKNDGTLT